MRSSGSRADALSVIVAGAVNVAPFSGEVSETSGGRVSAWGRAPAGSMLTWSSTALASTPTLSALTAIPT